MPNAAPTAEQQIQVAAPLRAFAEDLQLPANDDRIRAFNKAVLCEIDEAPDFRKIVIDFVSQRIDLGPSQATNLLLRAFQKQFLGTAHITGYPEPYVEPGIWRTGMRDVYQDNVRREELIYDLHNRHAQTNITERYKAFALIMTLMNGTFDKQPNIWDIGAAQNQGLKKLALIPGLKKFPFGNIDVVNNSGRRDAGRSRKVNRWLEYTHGIGPSQGLDVEDCADEDTKEWTRACFYPSNYLNDALMEEYDTLDLMDAPGVSFRQADFSDPELAGSGDYPANSCDMVTYSAVLHQANEAQREIMLANGRHLLKPHGLIVVQDFARVDYQNPTRLQYYQNWFKKPYRYRTIISGPEENAEFREIFRWENGRCGKLKLQPALGSLALTEKLGLL